MKISNLYRSFLGVTVCLFASTVFSFAQEHVVLPAIKSEVDRNKSSLQLEQMRPPFFISYSIVERKGVNITAAAGEIITSNENVGRNGYPFVLVGDYQMNNRNYNGYSVAGNQFMASQMGIDDDPKGMTRRIWSDLDRHYKMSAELYESKTAAIKRQNLPEEILSIPDYEQRAPVEWTLPRPEVKTDKKYWEEYARKVTELFKDRPEITLKMYVSVNDRMRYGYNTEGTVLAVPDVSYGLTLHASMVTDDGQPVEDRMFVHCTQFEDVPELQIYQQLARDFVAEFATLNEAPLLKEPYIGPVLIEDEALTNYVNNIFFGNAGPLIARRQPISERDNFFGGYYGQSNWEMMKDKKVISRDLTITSLTGTEFLDGRRLDGYFPIDAEGVTPDKELVLVEDGLLRNMLSCRTPSRTFRTSNGHARLVGNGFQVSPGNIMLSSNNTTPYDDLKNKLIDMAKEEDYEYAYLVKRSQNNMVIYRIYAADGREELVRGALLTDLSIRTFRKIVGTSAESRKQNIITMGGIATYILPKAMLFEELEITPNNNLNLRTPYIVPRPTADNGK